MNLTKLLYTSVRKTTRNSCQNDDIHKGKKSRKKLKKGVDKWVMAVYYMQAASREAEKHKTFPVKNFKHFQKEMKKVLDKRKEMC